MADFSPAFALAGVAFSAYILYGLVQWYLGTEESRRSAMHTWEYVIVLAITTVIAALLLSTGIWAGDIVEEEIMPPELRVLPSVSPWTILNLDSAKGILMNASDTFLLFANTTSKNLVTFTQGMVALGIVPFTQAASIAFGQLSQMYYITAGAAFTAALAAGYAAKMAAMMVDFFPLFVMMIATGRRGLAGLGAGLVAFLVVATPLLPVTAMAVMDEPNKRPVPIEPIVPSNSTSSFSSIVNAIMGFFEAAGRFFDLATHIPELAMYYAHAIVVFAFAMFIMAGATMSVSYALSDIPQAFEVPML